MRSSTTPKIVNVLLHLKRRGFSESTLLGISKSLKQLARYRDIDKSDEVLDYIMSLPCSNSRKRTLTQSYSHYAEEYGINFEKPKLVIQRLDPFIPTEELLDALVDGLPLRLSVYCQFLKETAARAGEAWMLKWRDIDFQRRLVRVTPEKNSNPRTVKVSGNLLDRINRLNNRDAYVFRIESNSLKTLTRLFERGRKKLAEKLQNHRLRMVHFHTFRHWKATMEYMKTRDILHVKVFLGHKNVNNTLKYIRYAESLDEQEDEWTCRVAKTLEEATELIESGFEYVTEMDGVGLFRKRK